MNEKDFGEVVKQLEELNAVVTRLDPSIRLAAFEILRSVSNQQEITTHGGGPGKSGFNQHVTLENLMEAHPDTEPHENANLVAASWYGQYGTEPFSLEKIRSLGNGAGLTIPERLDMTFKQAKSEGKALFQAVGRGLYRPTVSGEAYLKRVFGITKGTKKIAEGEDA